MCWPSLGRRAGQAKRHPSLSPLFTPVGAGGTGATLSIRHLASFNPDVNRDRKNNPESWNKLGANDQYKFYSGNVDYSRERPRCLNEMFPSIAA
uniref:Cytochrome c oxidase subunit NDUFA4 n=1 Tax=Oryctolagus cuniculus TaxID=9986 RepID=A0A5F9CGJ9_RABIT